LTTNNGIWRSFAIVGAISLLAAACGPAAGPTPGGGPAATQAADQPQQGGRIIYGTASDVQRLNPSVSNDNVSTRAINKIYDTLITVDPKTAEVKPWLGSWTVSSDGLTFSWTIDAKANWSDGKPITGKDFLIRVKMQGRSKITPNKSTFNDVDGYQDYSTGKATEISGIKLDASDPKKFTVKFSRIFCPALTNVFGSSPQPDHVFGKYIVDADAAKNADEAPEINAPPVASGPYKFKEWRKGDQLILTRNENYFKGAPYIEEWVSKVVADSTVLAAQLKTGEITVGQIQPADYDTLKAEERLKIYEWTDNGYTYIGWRANNPNVAFLGDKRIRQALWYGIDIDAVVKSVLLGHGAKQLQHASNVSWAAVPPDQLNQYKYDKAKAEDLIKQAGYAKGTDGFYAKDGKTLAVTIPTNQGNKTRETFLQVAVEQYKQIGVKITPKVEAFESLVPKLTGGAPEIEAIIIGWQLGTDPDAFTVWHSSNVASPTKAGNNFVGFKNADVDKALDSGRNGPDCSQAARQKLYQGMNKILNDEAPYMFGFAVNRILATDGKIQGITTSPFYPDGDFDLHKWWIKTK
jgi:peptide/nickel transport system substrate-binding protein